MVGGGRSSRELLTDDDIANIKQEIADLRGFRDLAVSISENAKGQALLSALRAGFAKAIELGGAEKAIIFTESRRTQEYLVRLLVRERLRRQARPLQRLQFRPAVEGDLSGVGRTPQRHRPRHRLAHRRHARRARRVFPRQQPRS